MSRSAFPYSQGTSPHGWLLAIALGLSIGCASSGARAPQFYTGKDYGSEATFNPVSQFLNEGFDFVQVRGREKRFLRYQYRGGLQTIGRSLAHPIRSFESAGWDHIIREELLPLGSSGAWIPNYQLHLLGSGMVYARMEEWFAHHGVPMAAPLAAATMMASHALNEIVEEGNVLGGYLGSQVLDLLVFDLGGILLYQSPRVRTFMHERMNFTNWPGQPSFRPSSQPDEWTIENASQSYVFKIPVRSSSRWFFFGNWGIGNMYGVTRRAENGSAVSVAVGVQSGQVIERDDNPDHNTVSLHGQAAIFYDRDNSLLASIVASGSKYRGVEINLYPGALWRGAPRVGLWTHLPRTGPVGFGITVPWAPGAAWRGR
jgi:hypothetical protein